MADTETAYEEIRAQVDALRATDARTPIALHLGTGQRDVIEAHVRAVSGQADVGPVVSFHGLAVKSSKRADHVVLLYAEGDDPDPIDEVVPNPAEPAVPVEAAPSGG